MKPQSLDWGSFSRPSAPGHCLLIWMEISLNWKVSRLPSRSDSLWYCDKMLSKEPDKHLEDLRDAWFEEELSKMVSVPLTTTFSHTEKLSLPTWLDFHSMPPPFLQVWNHRQQVKHHFCLLRAVRLYAAPSWPSARKSRCEWRYKGLAGEVMRWFSWGLLGVCCFAFPAFTVSSSNCSPVFLVPFYLQDSNWLAPPTSQTLAHLHSPPCDPEIASGKNMQSKPVRENLPPECVVTVGDKVPISWWSCWGIIPGGEVDIFSTPSGSPSKAGRSWTQRKLSN